MLKRIALSLLALLSCSLLFINSVTQPVIFKEPKSETIIEVDTARIKKDVYTLTSTEKPRNHLNIESLNAAADYIKSEMETLDLRVSVQSYRAGNNADLYKNIICFYGREDAPRLIVGAHYDVCGDQQGADDNASGTAGLIELARLLNKYKPKLDYRIDLVAYSLEEPPFFRSEVMGSHIHAKSLYDNNIDVKAMICLEMIGYFTDEKKTQSFPVGILKLFYPTTGNFIAIVGKMGEGKLCKKFKKNMTRACEVDVRSINVPKRMAGIDYSDHLNYWKYDYSALMVTNTSFYRNKAYHTTGDTPDRLDYYRMGEVIKGVYEAITHMK